MSLMLESRDKMTFRANTYRVNVICILILIMIQFSYTKRLNELKTDGLNTEVYGLCLLGEKNFVLLLMRVPKLPRKKLIFLLLLWRYRIMPRTACSRKFDRYIKIERN